MERSHAEIAKAALEDIHERSDWQTAVQEMRRTIVGLASLVDDLEERVAQLENPDD